jgi:hypothetical protein
MVVMSSTAENFFRRRNEKEQFEEHVNSCFKVN